MADHVTDSVGRQMSEQAAGMIDRVKLWFTNLGILQRLQEHKQLFIDMGVCLGVGFVLGFVVKRYLKYILLLVLFLVTLVIFEQFNLINMSVNWQKIQELFNIKQNLSFDEHVIAAYMTWMQERIWLVLSASVGFLIGLTIG